MDHLVLMARLSMSVTDAASVGFTPDAVNHLHHDAHSTSNRDATARQQKAAAANRKEHVSKSS